MSADFLILQMHSSQFESSGSWIRFHKKKVPIRAMSLSYHRQADLAFAQKQVEEFSSACFLFLPNTNRQIFICLKKLYSLIQIYATLYKEP